MHSRPSGRPRRDAVFPRGVRAPDLDTLDYSAICGVARVVDVATNSRSKWFWHPDDGSTNYGWVLASATALNPPIRCDGALRLREVPPKIFNEIQSQLPNLKLDV
jgi:hypothetical protein